MTHVNKCGEMIVQSGFLSMCYSASVNSNGSMSGNSRKKDVHAIISLFIFQINKAIRAFINNSVDHNEACF